MKHSLYTDINGSISKIHWGGGGKQGSKVTAFTVKDGQRDHSTYVTYANINLIILATFKKGTEFFDGVEERFLSVNLTLSFKF